MICCVFHLGRYLAARWVLSGNFWLTSHAQPVDIEDILRKMTTAALLLQPQFSMMNGPFLRCKSYIV